ncbi:zinc-dependent peptidase [Mariniblastus sp.]|nr:zinc-dependent peptidase [Mariniblastus sp.]MDB4483936.1 zinc-dependent peptidase [bacterium]MDA7903058.1 zinc-dependent peptidase [Mariniblastus sp.]MDA7906573.1 zinc-dependent peptidase [Mariniblastus sp.]MDA7924315.1 zinc-dependent peptidase [Mariniblastus sp.]
MFSFLKNRRRRRLLSQPFPSFWEEIIKKNVWQYSSLSPTQQQRILQCSAIIVAEKSWEAVKGFQVTDEVKLTISATAALLTLGLKEPFYFDRVSTILVHPDLIENRAVQQGQLVSHETAYYSGLAWQGGPLVFSWRDALRGASRPGDGRNVIIHEFIHHIDGLDGEMGGMPIISSEPLRHRWDVIFQRRFAELNDDLDSGREPRMDAYAATSLAEFFAVSGENFFDSPTRLKQKLPDVYDLLHEYFDIDPVQFEQ